MIAVTDWSVSIDTEGFVEADRVAEVCDALVERLSDRDAAVAGSRTQLGVTMTITTVAGAGQAAVEALDVWHSALRELGLQTVGESAVEVVSAEEQDRRLSESSMPEIWSTPEVATYLGVSRQRVHQLLGEHPTFPPSLQRLGSGPIWLADTIRAFDRSWDRRPGRPRKAVELAAPPDVASNQVVTQKPRSSQRAKVTKSATTGRFVNQSTARKNPRSTIRDT
jgi:hypothetical protein